MISFDLTLRGFMSDNFLLKSQATPMAYILLTHGNLKHPVYLFVYRKENLLAKFLLSRLGAGRIVKLQFFYI